MSGSRVRSILLSVGLLCLGSWPAAAAAQEVVRTFPDLQGRVLSGETVTVLDKAGVMRFRAFRGLSTSVGHAHGIPHRSDRCDPERAAQQGLFQCGTIAIEQEADRSGNHA